MKPFFLILIALLLLVYGGPLVPVAFLHLPVLFVLAVFILAAAKIIDLSKTKRS